MDLLVVPALLPIALIAMMIALERFERWALGCPPPQLDLPGEPGSAMEDRLLPVDAAVPHPYPPVHAR